MFNGIENAIRRQFEAADIRIGGNRPWDITVHDRRFFRRLVYSGSIGAGESYMDGWWDSPRIDQLAERLLRAGFLDEGAHPVARLVDAVRASWHHLFGKRFGPGVADMHYNQYPSLFEAMLGPTMNYSCAYWRAASDLDGAQTDKMELICRKLELRRGDRLIDIGCGWGGLALYAAKHFGCDVVAVTNTSEQAQVAREACQGHSVTVHCCDYRDPKMLKMGTFDKVVSVGMFEHVGRRHYAPFATICENLLADSGVMLLQTFGRSVNTSYDAWTDRYIFPKSYLPTLCDIGRVFRTRLVVEDLHNFGADYDRTLLAWHERFERWAQGHSDVCPERFVRMWRYYLLTYAACFRVRNRIQLWQIVLSKNGVPGGYRSIREPGSSLS